MDPVPYVVAGTAGKAPSLKQHGHLHVDQLEDRDVGHPEGHLVDPHVDSIWVLLLEDQYVVGQCSVDLCIHNASLGVRCLRLSI